MYVSSYRVSWKIMSFEALAKIVAVNSAVLNKNKNLIL